MASYVVKKFIRQFRNNILAGLFLTIPVGGSLFIVYWLFNMADKALPRTLGMHWPPFAGLIVLIMLLYFVGFAAKNYFGRKVIATGNTIILGIPLLSKIYLIIKQIIDTVTVDKKKLFERAVLLEFPRKECFVIGLVTSENNGRFSSRAGRKLTAVFVPKAPNPTSGFLLYVPEEDLIDIDLPVEAALKLVISGGILGAEDLGSDVGLGTPTRHWKWTDIFRRKPGRSKTRPPNDPRD
jgi:uncharacterized membrane protein